MRFIPRFLGVLLFLVMLSVTQFPVTASPDRSAPPVSQSNLEAFVDGITADRMDDLDPGAMMVTVVLGDEVFAKAYGIADQETKRRAENTTLFRIGSISKTFTWLSVMMMVDDGKIDLDVDVNRYLTQFEIPEKFGKPVTMRDIMAHRAGFEDTPQIFFDPRQDASLADFLKSAMPERAASPGERISYSNWASALAALVVQNRSGMAYDQFVQRRILKPLGMKSTTLHDPFGDATKRRNPPALDARMARPMRVKNGMPEGRDYFLTEPFHPAGAMALDARDAGIYMRMLLNRTRYDGGRLLSDDAWVRMQGLTVADTADADDIIYGFQRFNVAGYPAFGHAGATAFRAQMVIVPELDLGIFVSENSTANYEEVRELAELIVRRISGKVRDPIAALSGGSLEAAQELVGTYIVNRRSFTRAEKFVALGGDRTIISNLDGSISLNTGQNARRYVPVGNDIWAAADGQRIKAIRDDAGHVFRLTYGIDTMDRAGFLERSASFNLALGLVMALSITTLLGAWWRFGRNVPTTPTGRQLRYIPLIAALTWLTLAGVLIWLTMTLAALEPGIFASGEADYPPLAAKIALLLTLAVAAVTVISLVAIFFVWLKSGWTIWRRIHFTVYATTMVLAVCVMWNWNMIGKPLYDFG